MNQRGVTPVQTSREASTAFRSVAGVDCLDPVHESDPESARWVKGEIERLISLVDELAPTRDEPEPGVVEAFYSSPGLRAWSETIPSAAALWPLYNAHAGVLHDGRPLDEVASAFFRHCLDARGIRSRGAVTQQLLRDILAGSKNTDSMKWASLACGAAEAVCPVVSDAIGLGLDVTVDLVDRDPVALALSMQTAESAGCASAIRTVELDVLRLRELVSTLGEAVYDVVDILGFFEYLPTDPPDGWVGASDFLAACYRMLAPGGHLVMANMLDTHPQLPFTLHAVRWPYIQPRPLEELGVIIERAGIPLSVVDVLLPADGVYAVLRIEKPAESLS